MPRGGYRAGAGRKAKAGKVTTPRVAVTAAVSREVVAEARDEGLSPLEYMLKVMNNPEASIDRRDRMAIAAAPYQHGKADSAKAVPPLGKKQERADKAKDAATKFNVPSGPRLAVNNA